MARTTSSKPDSGTTSTATIGFGVGTADRPFVIRNSSFGIPRGPEHADTFRRDLHPDLRADYVLANPPFNDSDWFPAS